MHKATKSSEEIKRTKAKAKGGKVTLQRRRELPGTGQHYTDNNERH